jgi:two-component system, OmpR family, Ni(II)-sensor and/or redox sensor kinase NrsS
MNTHQLFRRSRAYLALCYAGVMAVILGLLGFSMYRFLIQSNWEAIEQEIESIAGTLHDSLEPMLTASENPTTTLQRILPELCLVGQPCNISSTLIQRHTTGISDRSTYYIRLFNRQGKLLAFSLSQVTSELPQHLITEPWQTFESSQGIRYHQFTIILHSHDSKNKPHLYGTQPSWGYLQIGRTLESFDAEVKRIKLILAIAVPVSLILIALSSWWLSKLAMQPIYKSYQQQQQFTANAAHELRSPLASLLATVEAFIRLPQTNLEDTKNMLYKVEKQGRRLSNLIADLLLLTSLEQNLSQKPLQRLCLNDLISDLTEEFLELAAVSNIHLTNQIFDREIYLLGNESQLYRLVSNLITNAIKYTPANGHVEISLSVSKRYASISIKDTGIGIPHAEQPRVFDRFYRVNSDRSSKAGGTGLGLAIARTIALRHQGYLTIKSKIGFGSVFTIHLPI